MKCYFCANETARRCETCRLPVCKTCAQVWPTYAVADRFGVAACRACTLAAARREVDNARRWLIAEGLEPEF